MAQFSLKDIPQLTPTTNTGGGQKIATAVPTGVGSEHNLRHIEKADFLTFDGTSIPTRQDGGVGPARVLNLKNTDSWLEYIGAAQALILRGGLILGVSPDGGSIPARLQSDGTVAATTMSVIAGGNSYKITNEGTGVIDATVKFGGELKVKPETLIFTGNNINIPGRQESLVYWDPSSPSFPLPITMPSSPEDGWRVTIYFAAEASSVTHTAPGDTDIITPITSASNRNSFTYHYVADEDVWILIGEVG